MFEKSKTWRGVTKKGRVTKKWLKRHGIVYDIIISLLLVGIIFFGVKGAFCIALRTDDPYRAVISDSMKHEGGEKWKEFYLREGYDVSGFPLQGGFERGDLMFVQGVNALEDVKIGDVVVYTIPWRPIPNVHRVIAIANVNGEIRFITKGDNPITNPNPDPPIKPEQIIGKVVFVIPKLGHLSLWWQGQ